MQPGDARWVEVSPSQFTHEAEGLSIVRALLPDQPPFRAWSNFEFRDGHGRWHEVDLLVLGRAPAAPDRAEVLLGHAARRRPHAGCATATGPRTRRSSWPVARPSTSPASSRTSSAPGSASSKVATPRTSATSSRSCRSRSSCTTRSSRSELSAASAIGLYGLDGHEATRPTCRASPSCCSSPPTRASGSTSDPGRADERGSVWCSVGEREAGSWVIENEPVAEGDGLAGVGGVPPGQPDRPGPDPVPGRRRRAPVEAGAAAAAPDRRARVPGHGPAHPRRACCALATWSSPTSASAWSTRTSEGWQRLDLWRAEQPHGVPLDTQLAIIRQVGEALQYAHGNRVVHRGLAPRPSGCGRTGRGAQGPGAGLAERRRRLAASQTTSAAVAGVTSLLRRRRPTPAPTPGSTEAFAAPEGALAQRRRPGPGRRLRARRAGLLPAGRDGRPARSTGALRERLREQSGPRSGPRAAAGLRARCVRPCSMRPAPRSASGRRTSPPSWPHLTAEERRDTEHEPAVDPLDAAPGRGARRPVPADPPARPGLHRGRPAGQRPQPTDPSRAGC